VLAGDAAHTIHPLAGQGVNLGFQDAEALCQVLEQAVQQGEDIASLATLQRYQRQRMLPNHGMQRLMDAFCYGFSNDSGPLRFVRNLGLKLANHSGPVKKEVIRYALGLSTPDQLLPTPLKSKSPLSRAFCWGRYLAANVGRSIAAMVARHKPQAHPGAGLG
jgi:2-octaprenyl-3-methyl-6-methoxy-1,4-benzoquinol hydroxylase